eukprot:12137320-Alexandrium_andersonii.AAC.1
MAQCAFPVAEMAMSSASERGTADCERITAAIGLSNTDNQSMERGSPCGMLAGLLNGTPTEEARVFIVERPANIADHALTTPGGEPCLSAIASTTCLLT